MEVIPILSQKIISPSEIEKNVLRWKFLKKKIVFTNGVFDILHPGHVDYLARAAALGDLLIVGLNSDSSVKTLNKGENRPINQERARAIVLAGLQSVACVVVFGETTPLELIKKIMPNVLAKGGDYSETEIDQNNKKYIVGSDIVKNSGGMVKVIPFLEGFSTTSMIKKIVG